MYRIGYPFWKALARHGVPLTLRVNVVRDDDAGVYVATSDDLRGLVAEAGSMDDLVREVRNSVDDLLSAQLHAPSVNRPVTDLRICAA